MLTPHNLALSSQNNYYLANLCDIHDANLSQLQQHVGITIAHRRHDFYLTGQAHPSNDANTTDSH